MFDEAVVPGGQKAALKDLVGVTGFDGQHGALRIDGEDGKEGWGGD